MKILETRNYYSLTDLAEAAGLIGSAHPNFNGFQADEFGNGLYDIISNILTEAGVILSGTLNTDDTYTMKLWKDYLCPRYVNEPIMYIDKEFWDEEPTFDEILEESGDVLAHIYAWLNESRVRYSKLISLYEEQENKLLSQLGSNSTTKFNDTPQDGGNFVDDNHVSTATTVSTTADVGTPMARLKEIQDDLDNLYGKWANEFRRFVMFH